MLATINLIFCFLFATIVCNCNSYPPFDTNQCFINSEDKVYFNRCDEFSYDLQCLDFEIAPFFLTSNVIFNCLKCCARFWINKYSHLNLRSIDAFLDVDNITFRFDSLKLLFRNFDELNKQEII